MRLINADDLIYMEYGGIKFVPTEFIKDAPMIDAVPVVRCKDCKWYDILQVKRDGTGDKRFKPSLCTLYNQVQSEDYYCADGSRMEEE